MMLSDYILFAMGSLGFLVIFYRYWKETEMTDYPKRFSDVEVVFHDGQVQTYRITAGSGLAPHLAKQAGETGILTLLCGAKAHSIPVANIREWNIAEIEGAQE